MSGLHYTKNEPFKRAPYYTAIVPDNGFVVGSLEQESDGYYYFYPHKGFSNGGFVPSWILMDLGHKLEALNEARNQKIAQTLNQLNNDN